MVSGVNDQWLRGPDATYTEQRSEQLSDSGGGEAQPTIPSFNRGHLTMRDFVESAAFGDQHRSYEA